jgi:HEPN domain-containing protein
MSTEKLGADAGRWYAQALDDLQAARVLLETGHNALAAFHAQQAAEKALKAFWRLHDLDPWGHSVTRLLVDLPSDIAGLISAQDLVPAGVALDKLYIPTRYPDALPGLTPAEAYTHEEGAAALAHASTILRVVRASAGDPVWPEPD